MKEKHRMISTVGLFISLETQPIPERKGSGVMLERMLVLIILLIGAGNLYAEGGEYWRGTGQFPTRGPYWFSSAQEVCDEFLPVSSPPGGSYPRKDYTFLNLELLGDEQNRAAHCYMEDCYTYYSTYLGREDTICGTVRYANAYRGFCPDQSSPDFAAKQCAPKFRIVAPTNGPCPEAAEGDPCDPMSGNVLLSERDISGGHGSTFTRRYQSMGDGQAGSKLGVNWTHNYGARLKTVSSTDLFNNLSVASSQLYDSAETACISGWRKIQDKAFNGKLRYSTVSYENGTCVIGGGKVVLGLTPDEEYPSLDNRILTKVLIRPHGGQYTFRKGSTGNWISLQDLVVQLTEQNDIWVLTLEDGTTEHYGSNGYIQQSITADGRLTQYLYDAEDQLIQVTHPNSQSTTFEYSNGRINRVVAPGGTVNYAYDEIGNLVLVTYPDNSTKQYLYEDSNFPHNLTGVIDENGMRSATWAYNKYNGKVDMNERAEGAEHFTFTYSRYGNTTVTDGTGATRIYYYDVFNNKARFTRVTGDRCDTCSHGDDQQRGYDDLGRILSRTDWNGITTTYVRDGSGLELSRTEAEGTPQARTITTEWHTDFRKPIRVTEPERVIEFSYDNAGRLLSKTERTLP